MFIGGGVGSHIVVGGRKRFFIITAASGFAYSSSSAMRAFYVPIKTGHNFNTSRRDFSIYICRDAVSESKCACVCVNIRTVNRDVWTAGKIRYG